MRHGDQGKTSEAITSFVATTLKTFTIISNTILETPRTTDNSRWVANLFNWRDMSMDL